MISWIAPRVLYLDRAEWGANTSLGRLGLVVAPSRRRWRLTHHSVMIDADASPNRWSSLAEVRAKQRQLQTIRPDLGLDLPYNGVCFAMEPQFRHEGRPVDLVLCEGRGLTRSGAHTAGRDRFGDYWNVSGIAICWQGNFHDFAAPWLRTPQIRESAQHMWGWVAFVQGLDGLRVA